MASGLPFKLPPYKSILAFLIHIGHLAFPTYRSSLLSTTLSLSHPGVTSLSDLGFPCLTRSSCVCIRTRRRFIRMYILPHIVADCRSPDLSYLMSVSFGTSHTDLSLEILPSLLIVLSLHLNKLVLQLDRATHSQSLTILSFRIP